MGQCDVELPYYPDAARGASGPVIGVSSGSGPITRSILWPESDLDGTSTSELMVSYLGHDTRSNAAVAVDPSRDGEPMMVFIQDA
jgi:hypothetical protein